MKKFLCIVLSIVFCVTLFSGCKDSGKTSSEANSPDTTVKAEGKPIKSADDLVGIWMVEMSFVSSEWTEACEEMGIKEFTPTAKNVAYLEITEDLTCGTLLDLEMQLDALKRGVFELNLEFYNHMVDELGEEEAKSVMGTAGCEFFNIIIEKKLLDVLKKNQSHKADDEETMLAYQDLAYEVMKDYIDAPIWEQNALGAIFGEVFEDVGHDFIFRNGEWIAEEGAYSVNCSFEEGVFTIYNESYTLTGDSLSFTLDGDGQFDGAVFTRAEVD